MDSGMGKWWGKPFKPSPDHTAWMVRIPYWRLNDHPKYNHGNLRYRKTWNSTAEMGINFCTQKTTSRRQKISPPHWYSAIFLGLELMYILYNDRRGPPWTTSWKVPGFRSLSSRSIRTSHTILKCCGLQWRRTTTKSTDTRKTWHKTKLRREKGGMCSRKPYSFIIPGCPWKLETSQQVTVCRLYPTYLYK